MSIMIRDPARIAEYKISSIDAKYEIICYIMYCKDKKTIPEAESDRLIEMVNSPDNENMEVVKVILEQKYKIVVVI